MKQHALHAIGELERQATARVYRALAAAHDVSAKRTALISHISGERQLLVSAGLRSSFDCYVLAARTVWSAALASALAAAQRREIERAEAASEDRHHWAACRRGLARRAMRRARLWHA